MDFDLDVSWLKDLDNLDNLDNLDSTLQIQQKERMTNIRVSFLYVNTSNEIHKVISEKHDLECSDDPFLSKDYLFSLVATKNKLDERNYRVLDVLLFHVDLDNFELASLSSYIFSRPVSYLADIVVPKSLPVFHSVNSLFFIFQEKVHTKQPRLTIQLSNEMLMPDDVVNVVNTTRKSRTLVNSMEHQQPLVHTRKMHKSK